VSHTSGSEIASAKRKRVFVLLWSTAMPDVSRKAHPFPQFSIPSVEMKTFSHIDPIQKQPAPDRR